VGAADKLTALECENTGGKLAAALAAAGAEKVVLHIDDDKGFKNLGPGDIAAHMALGMQLRHYTYGAFKGKDSQKAAKARKDLNHVTVAVDAVAAAGKLHKRLEAVAAGAHLARDLMNEPPNSLYPASYAARIQKELSGLGVSVEVLDDKKMKTLGMGAALAVGQGSARPPRMVVMRWNGKSKKGTKPKNPLAFVGKGVTFDTGGISIKPSASMDEMKMDMGGSAAVVGLMKSLALRKAKIDVVGIVGLAENMPSDRAYRPGDIITSMSGQTIEVLNTDAEGRLVLADALTYIQRTYKPKLVVDLATLTGAIMVALGYEYCGAFVNDDGLWDELSAASRESGEKIWRMPLDEAYRRAMDSRIADLNNLGDAGRYGGACTAAGFLQRFIEGDTKWAHLDIAGTMAWKADKPTVPRGPVGFGVRLLDRFVADHYE
jgi:leucyl aminopeptidase